MKRWITMLLALVMVLSMIPMTALPAFAEETLSTEEVPMETVTEPVEETTEETTGETTDETEPVEASVEKPATKNTEAASTDCGYEGTHYAGVINGLDASVTSDGELIYCADYFPDEAFRSYIAANIDTDGNGTLSTEELAVTEIDCSNQGIARLNGIEFFGDLVTLTCHSNNLTYLSLYNLPSLESVFCWGNSINNLELDTPALEYLWCDNNALFMLDLSACTNLLRLGCGTNELTELDLSNNTALEVLDCSTNKLTSLDVSANTALTNLNCSWNTLTELDLSNNTALTDLNCYNCGLSELDLSANTALKYLSCGSNALTALDVSANTALTDLYCYYNQLTTLDVSANTALTDLNCDNNQLTALDVSANTALAGLGCANNQLTALDISANTALTDLNCDNNQMTALDVSKNPALVYLSCANNALTTLDVSNNPNLWYLDCNDIGINKLDVSKNTELTRLWCSMNNLSELDISNNTKLTNFGCMDNNISSLDVSGHTELIVLQCGGNPLGTLNVSACTKLEHLDCSGQNLSELDVSANTKLVDLICRQGALEELILPEGYGLQHVYCNGNNLTELDVSGVLNLEWLDVSDNNLTQLDLSQNENLYSLVCNNNSLLELKLPADASIEELTCHDQYWLGSVTTTVNDSGWYEVDMSLLAECANITNVQAISGEATYDAATGIASFEEDPNVAGFTYEYMTGWDGFTITCHINVAQDEGGDDEGDGGIAVLDIPAVEDMTQLYLGEEVVVQWEEGDGYKWFYFTPEEDMVFSFLTTVDTNYEECLDPEVYATNEAGEVLAYNDDNGNLNSAICVNVQAGTTCYFAVRNINVYYGPLPVIILEGDYVQSDSGSDSDENFAQIAPPVEEMTAVEPDTDYDVQIVGGSYAWFTFTPTEGGTYSFSSSGEGSAANLDPYVWLLDEEMTVINRDNDSNGNWNFSVTYTLEAGKTYYFVATLDDYGETTGSFTVRLRKAKDITAISVAPITIPEGAWCEYHFAYTTEGVEAIPFYYWSTLMEVTLTFADGSTASGTGTAINHEGVVYQLYTFDYQGYDTEAWDAGNTYDVEIYTTGREVATETTVKITSGKIKSVSFDDITVMENTYGNWNEDYDEENETWVEYFRYNWEDCLSWTITFKDGKKLSGTGTYFEYKDDYYQISYYDNQQYNDPWEAGNTYTGNVYIAGIEKQVDISIRGTTEELAQVQNLKITDVGETSIKIAFDAVEDAERYEIYVNGNYWSNTTETSYKITGLSLGDGYDIYVAAAKKVDGKWYCGTASDTVWGRTYRDISNYYLKLEYSSTVYDGTEKCPATTLKKTSSSKTIASETYGRMYGMNIEVGQAWAEVFGMGQYGGYILKDFKILPQQVTGVEVTEVTSDSVTITFDPVVGATEYWVYRGSTRVAKITETTYTYTGLKAGTTYKFSVRANAVVQEMKPDMEIMEFVPDEIVDYTGKASATVSAKPVYTLEECTMTLKYATRSYTGSTRTNTVTIVNTEGKTLKKDIDYKVSYENNKYVGVATVTVTGKGKYAGTLTDTFVIVPATPSKPTATVLSGTSVSVSYKAVKDAQWYEVFVDGVSYGVTADTSCVITDLNAGQKYKITVCAGITLDGAHYRSGISDYRSVTPRHQMDICDVSLSRYSYEYTGAYLRPEVTVYGYEGQLLTEGVDYTLKFRNNKNTGSAYVQITGKGLYEGSVKEYYDILPAQVTGLKVSAASSTSVKISYKKASTYSTKYYRVYVNDEYVGRTTGSSYTIKNLTLGEVYDVYVIPEKTVSGVTYYGQQSDTLEVWPGTYIGGYKVTLEYTKTTFAGQPLCPTVVVKSSTKSNATVLVEGVDYDVHYEANGAPGKAKVIISGKGDYIGVITKTFTINPPKVTNVTATAVSKSQIEVSFDAADGATSYWVYVNGTRKAKITDITCVISGLSKNRTYKITVKAVTTVDGTNYTSAATDAVSCKTLSS